MDLFEIKDKEINVEKIVEQIKENIDKRIKEGTYSEDELHKKFDESAFEKLNSPRNSTNLNETLEYLNENWNVQNNTYLISSHRPVSGKFLVLGRKLINEELRRYVDPIVFAQNEFNSSNAKMLSEITFGQIANEDRIAKTEARCDSIEMNIGQKLNKEIYEEWKEEIKIEIGKKNREIREEIKTEIENEVSNQVRKMLSKVNQNIEHKVQLIDILGRHISNELDDGHISNNINEPIEREETNHINYFKFSEEISEAWTQLGGPSDDQSSVFDDAIKLFEKCNSVLDIGCGQGTFLKMLKESNIGGYGIDISEDYILYCKRLGLNVEKAEALTHLRSLENKSLDGIFMNQLIEHLSYKDIYEILNLSYEKLQYGSYIIVAFPNILSMIVSTNLFYMDPTHMTHIHPEVLKFILESCGFKHIRSCFYQPVADDIKLQKIESVKIKNDEKIDEVLRVLNSNIDKLNNLLFGYRDYCVIAKK